MSDAPNTSPAFMQSMGILGLPVDLTTQICTPSTPGSAPVAAYSSIADYALGNGALVEMIDIQLTGSIPATTILMFYRFTGETSPRWRKAASRAVAAATYDSTSELPSYKIPLKDILFPVPQVGTTPGFSGLRLNSSSRSLEWGFALTVAVTNPIIVTMYGGEY